MALLLYSISFCIRWMIIFVKFYIIIEKNRMMFWMWQSITINFFHIFVYIQCFLVCHKNFTFMFLSHLVLIYISINTNIVNTHKELNMLKKLLNSITKYRKSLQMAELEMYILSRHPQSNADVERYTRDYQYRNKNSYFSQMV